MVQQTTIVLVVEACFLIIVGAAWLMYERMDRESRWYPLFVFLVVCYFGIAFWIACIPVWRYFRAR
jgi:tryptophan-rich sensory protein